MDKSRICQNNPVDSTHSVLYNENNYFILATYGLLTSLPVHGTTIWISVGSWAKVGRWKVFLIQTKFRNTLWWSYSLLRMFITIRILCFLFAKINQYLLEDILFYFFANVNKNTRPYFLFSSSLSATSPDI